MKQKIDRVKEPQLSKLDERLGKKCEFCNAPCVRCADPKHAEWFQRSHVAIPDFVFRLVTKHRDFNMGDCWYADLHRLREGAEPESRNADLADTLEWLVAMHRDRRLICLNPPEPSAARVDGNRVLPA